MEDCIEIDALSLSGHESTVATNDLHEDYDQTT